MKENCLDKKKKIIVLCLVFVMSILLFSSLSQSHIFAEYHGTDDDSLKVGDILLLGEQLCFGYGDENNLKEYAALKIYDINGDSKIYNSSAENELYMFTGIIDESIINSIKSKGYSKVGLFQLHNYSDYFGSNPDNMIFYGWRVKEKKQLGVESAERNQYGLEPVFISIPEELNQYAKISVEYEGDYKDVFGNYVHCTSLTITVEPKASSGIHKIDGKSNTFNIDMRHMDTYQQSIPLENFVNEPFLQLDNKPQISIQNKTASSMTLNDVKVNQYDYVQYSKDNGTTWQDTPQFNDLENGQSYDFKIKQNIAGLQKYVKDEFSDTLTTRLNYFVDESAAVVETKLSTDIYVTNEGIDFTAKYMNPNTQTPIAGDERLVPISWLAEQETGTFSDENYSDVCHFSTSGEKYLQVTFKTQKYSGSQWEDTSETNNKTISQKITVVDKAQNPEVDTRTSESLTLKDIPGFEYSYDNGATWQSSPVFNNLTPNTEYQFKQRRNGFESETVKLRTARMATKEQNQISIKDNLTDYYKNDEMIFTAQIDKSHDKEPVSYDERYLPVSWEFAGQKGQFNQNQYTVKMIAQKVGTYPLTVVYAKHIYDGTQWVPQNESYEVKMDITVENAYINGTIQSNQKNVSISGTIQDGTQFIVSMLKESDENYKDLYKSMMNYEIIGAYDLSLDGNYQGKLTVSFNIDQKYNGQTVVISHLKHDGSIETFKEIVRDGTVKIEVEELSPFMIGISQTSINTNNQPQGNASTNHQQTETSDLTNSLSWISGLVLAGGVIVYMNRRKEINGEES